MSLIKCSFCESIFSAKADPDCFIEHLGTKLPDTVACESCREDMDLEQERYEAAQGKHESQAGV